MEWEKKKSDIVPSKSWFYSVDVAFNVKLNVILLLAGVID